MKTILIIIIATVISLSCKTPKEQVAAKPVAKISTQPVLKPAIAVNTKDTVNKKPLAHALHRDEPVHVDNGGGKPAKRTEASVVKPNFKQKGTYTPATLKNAPKPGGN